MTFVFYEGDEKKERIIIKDKDGNPIDLTGYEVRMYIFERGKNNTVFNTPKPLSIIDAVNGIVEFDVGWDVTSEANFYVYEIELQDPNGVNSTYERGFYIVLPSSKDILPTAIDNLVYWGDAKLLNLNNNDSVSSLTDKSGLGNDLTSSGMATPTYKKNIIKGVYPIVKFDGLDDYLSIPAISPPPILSNGGVEIVLGIRIDGILTNKPIFEWRNSTNGTEILFRVGSNPNEAEIVVGGVVSSSKIPIDSEFFVLDIVYDQNANNAKVYKNGSLIVDENFGSVQDLDGNFILGGNLTDFCAISVSELIIFKKILNENERNTVVNSVVAELLP